MHLTIQPVTTRAGARPAPCRIAELVHRVQLARIRHDPPSVAAVPATGKPIQPPAQSIVLDLRYRRAPTPAERAVNCLGRQAFKPLDATQR
jgi:hypothetical protein